MPETLAVTSPAFENEGAIPIAHTGRGEDVSPALHLSPLHGDARSVAIVMDDLGLPIVTLNHWVIWNLPALPVIPANIPHGAHVPQPFGAVQGRGYGRNRYRGPKPPFNASHRYRYAVYVLDCRLDLPASAGKRRLLRAMQGHVLQQGCIVGRFR